MPGFPKTPVRRTYRTARGRGRERLWSNTGSVRESLPNPSGKPTLASGSVRESFGKKRSRFGKCSENVVKTGLFSEALCLFGDISLRVVVNTTGSLRGIRRKA
ncbi:hypothetical protein [Desertivirga xinjiangensis]|uniref:hypothetical protein n=1 Tax=Desertivirga xinjiangensis TaxID=539206 RepID=UPI00210A6AA7|nr:hypothetical protein [Pedobacter xinjiangensis]